MNATSPITPDASVSVPAADVALCSTCDAVLQGRYCHECGERRLEAQDHTLRALAASSMAGAFDLDGRLFRSVHAMVLRPGLMTREYMRGSRVRWLGPLQLFLLVNLLFFSAQSALESQQTFTTQLRYHVTMVGYGDTAKRLVDAKGLPGTAERVEYERRFNEATPRYANSLVILMVPMIALVVGVLRGFRGSAVRHIVFSLNFMSFIMAFTAFIPLLLTPIFLLMPELMQTFGDTEMSLLFLVVICVWLYVGFRRGYDDGRMGGAVRAVLLASAVFPVLIVYRAILFFVVYRAIG